MFNRVATAIILFTFITSSFKPVLAQEFIVSQLPTPGTMVNLSPAYVPVLIKGLRVHPENPLIFDFILDTGKSALKFNSPGFKEESQKLIKYFLASLTIKEDDLWVNLSPYEKDRIIPDDLGKTELGRDMLAQDYILKQLTASLIYPERKLGKEFWDRVYTKARQMFGTVNVPVDTFNKVWIIADKAKILERNNVGYVVGAHLKVMLEEDYLALSRHSEVVKSTIKSHTIASQIIRAIILPEIEKEVNQGQNFAPLRQIFYSMILASWYKLSLKDALLNQVYSNKGKTGGVLSDDPEIKEKIYVQYLKAYRKGVFNYIKEDMNVAGIHSIPRKYFSGGLQLIKDAAHLIDRRQNIEPGDDILARGDLAMVTVNIRRESDRAQSPEPVMKGPLSREFAELTKQYASFAASIFFRPEEAVEIRQALAGTIIGILRRQKKEINSNVVDNFLQDIINLTLQKKSDIPLSVPSPSRKVQVLSEYLKKLAFENGYVFLPIEFSPTADGQMTLSLRNFVGPITSVVHARINSTSPLKEMFVLELDNQAPATIISATVADFPFNEKYGVSILVNVKGISSSVEIIDHDSHYRRQEESHEFAHMALSAKALNTSTPLAAKYGIIYPANSLGFTPINGATGIERVRTFLEHHLRTLQNRFEDISAKTSIQLLLWEAGAVATALEQAGQEENSPFEVLYQNVRNIITGNTLTSLARLYWLAYLAKEIQVESNGSYSEEDLNKDLLELEKIPLNRRLMKENLTKLNSIIMQMFEHTSPQRLREINRGFFLQHFGRPIDSFFTRTESSQLSMEAFRSAVRQQSWGSQVSFANLAMTTPKYFQRVLPSIVNNRAFDQEISALMGKTFQSTDIVIRPKRGSNQAAAILAGRDPLQVGNPGKRHSILQGVEVQVYDRKKGLLASIDLYDGRTLGQGPEMVNKIYFDNLMTQDPMPPGSLRKLMDEIIKLVANMEYDGLAGRLSRQKSFARSGINEASGFKIKGAGPNVYISYRTAKVYAFIRQETRTYEETNKMYDLDGIFGEDGNNIHRVLLIGVGWGMTALEMALKYPQTHIVAVNKEENLWDDRYIQKKMLEKGYTQQQIDGARARIDLKILDIEDARMREQYLGTGGQKYDLVLFEVGVAPYLKDIIRTIEYFYNSYVSLKGFFGYQLVYLFNRLTEVQKKVVEQTFSDNGRLVSRKDSPEWPDDEGFVFGRMKPGTIQVLLTLKDSKPFSHSNTGAGNAYQSSYSDFAQTVNTVTRSTTGGIDLNAKYMALDVAKDGKGIEMKFDPAMVAEFQRGDFSGISPDIIRIIPITSALQILGMETSPTHASTP